MKNQDMPAMPVAGKIDLPAPRRGDPLGSYKCEAHGLTKLEHFAGMAMQGLCASEVADFAFTDIALAETAVLRAKALLEELEKQQ